MITPRFDRGDLVRHKTGRGPWVVVRALADCDDGRVFYHAADGLGEGIWACEDELTQYEDVPTVPDSGAPF